MGWRGGPLRKLVIVSGFFLLNSSLCLALWLSVPMSRLSRGSAGALPIVAVVLRGPCAPSWPT